MVFLHLFQGLFSCDKNSGEGGQMRALENPRAAYSQYDAHKIVQLLFCKFSFQVCQELFVNSLFITLACVG